MGGRAAGLRHWTRRFLLAGGLAFVVFLLALLSDGGRRIAVLLGLYGFVCSTIFGMGYLLLPAYAGRTLVDRRLAGVHFVLAANDAQYPLGAGTTYSAVISAFGNVSRGRQRRETRRERSGRRGGYHSIPPLIPITCPVM